MTFFLHIAAAILLAAASTSAVAEYRQPDQLDDGWASADAGNLGWNTAKFSGLETRITDPAWKGITSVVVADRGKLVFERYFNEGARDVLNDMRSATKTLTALLAGAAIDRSLIVNVQAKAYPYFRNLQPLHNADPRKDTFTLEDLLTMSSLWECNDDNPFSTGNEERMYVSENWLRFALELPIKGFAPWMTKPADSPYGRSFSYCTAGSFVAGALVERAVRKHLDAFAAEALEKPLGIAKSKWNFSPDGIAMGGGGARYTSRDIAKIGQAIADDGRWLDRQVISKNWIQAMLTPHAQARDDAEYGYLIWRFHFALNGKDQAVWAMSGNGGNYVFILPERRLVAVVTSRAYNQRNAHAQSQELFRDFILAAMPASH